MAISTDPNDPNFGLEMDTSSPNFGLVPEHPQQTGLSLAQAIGGARSGMQTELQEARQFVSEPGIEIPRIPQQQGVLAQAGAGLVNTASGVVEGLVSPQTIASLPVAPLRLAQIAFAGQAFQDIGSAYEEAARPETTIQRGLELGGRAVVDALLGTTLIKGATIPRGLREVAFGEKPVAPEVTPQISETPITDVVTQKQPIQEEVIPSASEITSPESVTQPEVRPRVGEEAPLRQQGETPEARQEVPTEEVIEPVPQPEQSVVPAEAPVQRPSKIGESIEAKAVEAKLTEGFSETAGYDPITIRDQAERATNFIKSSLTDARAVIRGDATLPEGLRGTSLITAMEEELLRKPDPQLAYELANSPITSATSAAAQEMRLMSERVPDSITAKFAEIQEARRAGSKLRGETPERLFQEIHQEIVKQSSNRPTWEAFVREITC